MHTSVSAYLAWDHDELDAEFTDITELVGRAAWDAAADRMREFAQRLRRHIGIEEDILFPIFDQRVTPDGPTRVMRAEHAHIQRALDAMTGAIGARDAGAFSDARADFDAVLPDHNLKEERILYPAIDELLGRDGAAVLERVRNA